MLATGRVLATVAHAWEANEPWQIDADAEEVVEVLGGPDQDGWVEVHSPRRGGSGAIPASYLASTAPDAPAAVAEAWERATETAARPPRPDLPRPDFPDQPLLSQGSSPGTPQAGVPLEPEAPAPQSPREQYFALVAAVVAEGLVHRDGANLVDDAAARHGFGAAELEAALRSCGWTVDEWSRGPEYAEVLEGALADGEPNLDDRAMVLDFERERGVEPRERTRALRGLGWSDDDIFPDQPSPSASSTRTTRSLRSAASASHSRAVQLALSDVAAATNHWRSRELGQGGFGRVYEGQLARFGRVAIKRLESSGGQGEREFLAELEMLAGLRDARLVRLLGYAAEGDEKCLVYQYLAGGTLEARLHGTATAPMTWIHRLQCAVEVSQALYYLHHCAHRATNEAIVHGDIKSANILFDAAGAAKLADFGMARRMEGDLQHTMTLAGSKGYLDPHYVTHGRLGPTSDVYSFGVVLLELLTAERAFQPTRPSPNLVGHCFSEAGAPRVTLDASLDAPSASTKGLVDVARRCTRADVGERMTLEQCIEQLVMLESSESERQAAAAAFRAAPPVPPRVVAVSAATTRSSEASASFRDRPLRVLAVTLNCGDAPLKAVELRAFLRHGRVARRGTRDVLADVVAVTLQEVKLGSSFARVGELIEAHLSQHERVPNACIAHLQARMFLLVFRRRDVAVSDATHGRVIAGGLVKGACCAALTCAVADKSYRLAFVGCHLPAHEGKLEKRNGALRQILDAFQSFLSSEAVVFTFGDLNYRINTTYDDALKDADAWATVVRLTTERSVPRLAALDELTRQPQVNIDACGLAAFWTPALSFLPTFKCIKGVAGLRYNRKRVPSYTDRVLFRPGSNTDVTCVAHENAPAVTSSDHKPVSAAFEISAGELQCAQFESARRVDIVDASTRMSHAGFGNVHGDIVDLATSGGAAPAFPPVEDDLRLPAQPKDVSDLRKGDVVAFDEAHLPGHEAFPCVKLKQLGAAVAKVLQRNVKASFYQGLSALADRLILRRPIVRCIVVVQDRILVVDTRGRTALNYGGTGTVKSNRHVSTFSHASYPRTKDRDVFALHFRNPPKGELVPGSSIDGPAPGHPAAAGVLRGHVRPALALRGVNSLLFSNFSLLRNNALLTFPSTAACR